MITGRPKKTYRNVAIVVLHKLAPKIFTLYRIGEILGISKQAVHVIWHRDNSKYDPKVIHSWGLDK